MNENTAIIKALKKFRENQAGLPLWSEGMSRLYQSGILDVLGELGKVTRITPDTPNYIEAQAAEANRAYGVNQAIDLLMNLRELLADTTTSLDVPAEFGGLEAALSNQDITKEEADAIRNNQPIPKLEPVRINPGGRPSDPGNKAVS